jgi:hypothetical protein
MVLKNVDALLESPAGALGDGDWRQEFVSGEDVGVGVAATGVTGEV